MNCCSAVLSRRRFSILSTRIMTSARLAYADIRSIAPVADVRLTYPIDAVGFGQRTRPKTWVFLFMLPPHL